MANYATLKAAIQAVIKTNANEEITGAILQQTLLSMINTVGAGYQFIGVATPTTVPGTPDPNVFYIAGPGYYPNFNSASVREGNIAVFKYNGSWTIETFFFGGGGNAGTISFSVGAWNISGGVMTLDRSQKNRIFSQRYINYADVQSIRFDADNYQIQVIYLDADLNYVASSGYISTEFTRARASDSTYANTKYILLIVKKNNDSNFGPGDDPKCQIFYSNETAINLEDLKCGGVSLAEMFGANMVLDWDLQETTTPSWSENFTGRVDSDNLSYAKAMYSTTRRYQSLTLKQGHKYLVGVETKIESVDDTLLTSANNMLNFYGGGGFENNRCLGIFLIKPFGNMAITKGVSYSRVVGVVEAPITTNYGDDIAYNYTFGNCGVSGMITGYSRVPVCIDLTELAFTYIPCRRELYNAYRRFCEYLRCQPVSQMNIQLLLDAETEFCDLDARRAFMEEMNNVANEIGCVQTDLYNPSGVYFVDHKTTCKDYIKIGAAAMVENEFLRITNRHSMDVPVIHANGDSDFIVPTEIAEYSGATGEASEVIVSDYDIVAAKTGSWNGATNESKTQTLVMLVRSKATGKFIVGYIHNGGANYSATWNDDKYDYMKNLFDKVEDNSVVLSLGTTSEWSAGYIPEINQWAKYVDFGTVKNNDTVQFAPASTTKYLTCIIALKHLRESDDVVYETLDYSTGSGAAITFGDKFKVRDAIYLCMASSSNSLANMFGRIVGHKLLKGVE